MPPFSFDGCGDYEDSVVFEGPDGKTMFLNLDMRGRIRASINDKCTAYGRGRVFLLEKPNSETS